MERKKVFGDFSASVFLSLYIIALPFHRAVWKLPFFGDKVQPAEIFLGILAVYFLCLAALGRVRYWFSPFDVAVVLWLLVNFAANAMVGFNNHLLWETLKVVSVALLYFVFRLLMTDAFLEKFTDIFLLSASIASVLAILGSALSFLGVQTVLTAQMQTYPYIGGIGRGMAFTSTPNMLGSILMTALLLKSAQLLKKNTVGKSEIILLGICSLAFVIAISKTFLCFLVGLLLLIYLDSKKRTFLLKALVAAAMGFLALVYLLGSHFVFTPSLTPRVLENMRQGHITRITHQVGPLLAVETSYLTIKSSCLHVLKRSFPWGIGTRNFKLQVPQLKEQGLYNKETMPFDPHCTPLGTLVELGLPGSLALAAFFILICKWLTVVYRNKEYPFQFLGSALAAIFLALCLESWVTDIMNFRHYWLLLAILAYMARQAAKPVMRAKA